MQNTIVLGAILTLPLLVSACNETGKPATSPSSPDSALEKSPPAAGERENKEPWILPSPQPSMPGPDTIPPSPQAQRQPAGESKRTN